MKRVLFSIASHVAFVLILWGWLFQGIAGAHNAAVFLIWVHGAIGLLLLSAVESKAVPQVKRVPKFVRLVSNLCDFAVICMLIWFGQFLLAAVYMFAVFAAFLFLSESKPKNDPQKT